MSEITLRNELSEVANQTNNLIFLKDQHNIKKTLEMQSMGVQNMGMQSMGVQNMDVQSIGMQKKNIERIDTYHVNPFTVRSISTEWKTNELIMRDPKLRVMSGVGPLDIDLYESSKLVSQQHLNPGWKWYGNQ